MRLQELIDFTPRDRKSNSDLGRRLDRRSNIDKLGSGSFGSAYSINSNKRLNQVTKSGIARNMNYSIFKELTDDGYIAYIKAIVDSGLNNPYFPRIDDFKVYKKSNNQFTYVANIERLIPLQSERIPREMASAMWEKMFLDEPAEEPSLEDIVYKMAYIVAGKNTYLIKDKQLKQALGLIIGILRDSKFMNDIYDKNIMMRITGNMPQLVFTDPIA